MRPKMCNYSFFEEKSPKSTLFTVECTYNVYNGSTTYLYNIIMRQGRFQMAPGATIKHPKLSQNKHISHTHYYNRCRYIEGG